MKKMLRAIILSTAIVPMFICMAAAEKKGGTVLDMPAASYGFSQIIDLSQLDRGSVQAIYSNNSATTTLASSKLVTSGRASTGTITVTAANVGISTNAWVKITVSSYGAVALSGAVITLNGQTFTEGVDWQIGTSSITTAKNISDAIDATGNFTSTYTLTTTAIVTASATDSGTQANEWAATVSTVALTLSGSQFSGGVDNGSIQIGSVILTQGVDWTSGATNALTAKAIADAMMANETLSALYQSTWNAAGVVTSTSVLNGNYNQQITGPIGATYAGYAGGVVGKVSKDDDSITWNNHLLYTGTPVVITTSSPNIMPVNLVNGVTYYAIRVNENIFQLATSTTNAVARTSIDIGALPAIVNSAYTITPMSLAGTPTLVMQASNDGVNFQTVALSTGGPMQTIAFAAPYTSGSILSDLGWISYRYLRAVYTAGTAGAANIKLNIFGKMEK